VPDVVDGCSGRTETETVALGLGSHTIGYRRIRAEEIISPTACSSVLV
jgi:hypothetical protein